MNEGFGAFDGLPAAEEFPSSCELEAFTEGTNVLSTLSEGFSEPQKSF
jgi:hypothetical protein